MKLLFSSAIAPSLVHISCNQNFCP